MNSSLDAPSLLLAGIAGLGLGLFFFGALWWTVQQALSSRRLALWHFASSLLRTAVALLGFYVVGAGTWQRLVACLAGFVLARLLVIRISPSGSRASGRSAVEGQHAAEP